MKDVVAKHEIRRGLSEAEINTQLEQASQMSAADKACALLDRICFIDEDDDVIIRMTVRRSWSSVPLSSRVQEKMRIQLFADMKRDQQSVELQAHMRTLFEERLMV
jgi:hypothetical protein